MILKSFVPLVLAVLVTTLLAACTTTAPTSSPTPTPAPATATATSTSTPFPTASSAPAATLATATAAPSPVRPTAPPAARAIFAAPAKAPLAWAQLLVQQVPLSRTAYEHKDTVVTWAGVGGATESASYADCSGFMNALLAQAFGIGAADFKAWLGAPRPLAKDYYAAIATPRGFVPVKNIANVQPGDIIAIRYLNSAPGDNTGHLLLVAAAPQRRTPARPVVNTTEQWDVAIIDSSETGHGKDDTRRLPDGSFHDGLGRGVMRLYTDGAGALAGYTWSDLSDSVFYDAAERPLTIGRLDPKFSLP
jgi:hypothetical protein